MKNTKPKPKQPNINKINYRKVSSGLVPISEEDEKLHELLKNNDVFLGGFEKIRNYENHKRAFSFLNMVFDFQNIFRLWEFKRFRKRMLFYAGAFDEDIIDGQLVINVWSMAFGNMDEYMFNWLFSAFIDAALEHFVWGPPRQQEIQSKMILDYA